MKPCWWLKTTKASMTESWCWGISFHFFLRIITALPKVLSNVFTISVLYLCVISQWCFLAWWHFFSQFFWGIISSLTWQNLLKNFFFLVTALLRKLKQQSRESVEEKRPRLLKALKEVSWISWLILYLNCNCKCTFKQLKNAV